MRRLRDLVDELLHGKVKAKLFGGEHAPKLGRLVIVDRIGEGAMGTVFAAYDPRLDRKVAVKVLRSSDHATRVLAEARALAKLAHPNVVTVHDADELDGLVYIVMELAPGVSLRTWVGSHREWHDIVRVMREAGAGIAAAHAAGLVHRDIKPDNILVGEDRTRVVDFGLATPSADDDGSSAGTPFYMASEVLAGGAATEASDQFSFAVTLYEALYGMRPHAPLAPAASGDAATVPATQTQSRTDLIANLHEAALQAAQARPPSSSVPAWLHAIVTRGLAAEPRDRFPSLSALVDALGRDRRRTRRIALAGAALVTSAVLGAAVYRSQTHGGVSCEGGPSRVEVVWNEKARGLVRVALGSARWTPQTISALDGHANDWLTSYKHVCQASRVRGEQSDTLLDLRMRCLDRSLDRFRSLVAVLSGALEPPARVAAPTAVTELPSPAACETLADAAELALPSDPKQRERVKSADHQLADAWALFSLGRYKDARAAVPAVEKQLDGVTAPRVRAEELSLASSVEARIGDAATARARLDEALVAAADAKSPELELDVWSRKLRNELFAGDPQKVIELAVYARAAARRAGREGADIDGVVAQALRNTGRIAEARDLLDHALASKDPLRAEQRALLEMNRGSIDLATGDSAAALALFQKAYDRVLSSLGDHHPELAIYVDKLATAKRARGELREALQLHDRSVEMRVAAFGAEDRALATALLYRAQTRLEGGDVEGARKDLGDAKAIREKAFGATSPRLAEVVAAQGDVAAAAGDHSHALELYADAARLDPHLDLVARQYAAGGAVDVAAIPPLGPGELLSIERVGALAVRVELLAKTHATEARTLAAALRGRYKPELDPALAIGIANALLAAGDRTGAAEIAGKAAAALGNEPTRTALRVYLVLARASDTQAPAAARAAVSVYQALPALDRTEFDAMWELAKH